MAAVTLSVVTLLACALLLILVHFELKASAPVVQYEGDDAEGGMKFSSSNPASQPPPPPPLILSSGGRSIVEPICQVTFGRSVCRRGGIDVPCPEKVDQVRHDTTASETGAWLLSPTYTYFLDRGLAGALTKLFAGSSVTELGAGKGCYAAELRRAPPARAGASRIAVRAFDGAPNVAQMTGGLVRRADLTRSLAGLTMPPSEWVLCLETAEHIPRKHEEVLLANLHNLNSVGVVLSWSNNAGGNGHVNLRTNEWVVQRFAKMGYVHDADAQRDLRRAVSDIHWFRDTLMVFRRQPVDASAEQG